jgi:O-glycosyl hydrolase
VGKPLWMTEVCCGAADGRSFDAVRARVVHIRDEMEYADAAAWVLYAWGHATSAQAGFLSDDIVVVDNAGGNDTVLVGNVGYAIGHFSRFVKRGAVRIGDASSDALVMPIAFRDLQGGKLVLVVVNNAAAPSAVTVNLAGVQVVGGVTGEQSTEAGGYWQPLAPIAPVSPGRIDLVLPPRSVTTLSAAAP